MYYHCTYKKIDKGLVVTSPFCSILTCNFLPMHHPQLAISQWTDLLSQFFSQLLDISSLDVIYFYFYRYILKYAMMFRFGRTVYVFQYLLRVYLIIYLIMLPSRLRCPRLWLRIIAGKSTCGGSVAFPWEAHPKGGNYDGV